MLRFDLGPLLQGQMRIVKLKSADNLFIIDPRVLQYETKLHGVMGWKSSGAGFTKGLRLSLDLG